MSELGFVDLLYAIARGASGTRTAWNGMPTGARAPALRRIHRERKIRARFLVRSERHGLLWLWMT